MRTKEDAHDYRYFPDPDLLPLVLREEQIKKIASEMPELPDATRERFARQYALPAHDAGVLTASRAAADYFEALVKAAGVDAKLCANWQTEKRGFRQISDSALIEKLVDEVLALNARQVQDYRSGKEKAFNSLVGQVMKATKGKADPEQVNRVLRRKLSG
jgi:aspartyl-tRNA(Asn)/glutamyl-tRNA(Gln) amidotransferase subunit B